MRQTVWVFIQRHRETERLALYRDTLRHTVGFLYRDTMRQTVGFYTETRWDRPLGFCIQRHRETDRRVFIQRHGETHCWVFIQLYGDTVRRAVGFYTDGEAHRCFFFIYRDTMRQTVGFYTQTPWDRQLGFTETLLEGQFGPIQRHRKRDHWVLCRHGEEGRWVLYSLQLRVLHLLVGSLPF